MEGGRGVGCHPHRILYHSSSSFVELAILSRPVRRLQSARRSTTDQRRLKCLLLLPTNRRVRNDWSIRLGLYIVNALAVYISQPVIVAQHRRDSRNRVV